ncbi:LacI family DNA-binding transcriptional regulator [Paenibacillus athensensis]|uniref:LacI family transcriptional regulator n=1 Tax=Paenibacillus athensensis TaxID=1967502 RepID=A0A4Y8PY87_9BACL|nr:LacI family DNA-binding transcriptional regulator [Paenibacillus athensensis]MCD1259663.1 LacI family DNA-binding transcriptional regulator [Paenibacillus athensensis]
MKKITLQTIAEHLNVSQALVSKALSNDSAVSDVTKELIWTTAKEMGYRMKATRKTVPASKTGTLAVVMPRGYMQDFQYWGKILGGIDEELSKHSFSMLLSSIDTSNADARDWLPARMHEGHVDGVIVLGHIPDNYMNTLKEKNYPFVMVDSNVQDPQVDHILSNNSQGAQQATRLLLEAGHRKLAFVGDVNSAWSFAERYRGFKQAVQAAQEAGIEGIETVQIEGAGVSGDGNYTSPEFSNALSRYVHRDDPVTAYFCANDMLAIETQSTFADMGVLCPQEVSIVGFDDLSISALTQPKLTTVKVPKSEMGKGAVELILQRINEPEAWPKLVLLSTFLVERDSVKAISPAEAP